jgi:hypothetical protein
VLVQFVRFDPLFVPTIRVPQCVPASFVVTV